jgi:D-serine deaminase-like pyridoxal phosphate-dependent protein
VQPADLAHLIAAVRAGAEARVVVDCEEHVDALAAAARAKNIELPVVIDVDVSYRPAGSLLHIGVRRSPLRDPRAIVELAERIAREPALSFHGVMGYEAQIAGVVDRKIGWKGPATRLMKRGSRRDVAATRARLVDALAARGLGALIVNGGGTGSLRSSCAEQALTEVTAGSAFLCGHLFDHYEETSFHPAAYFALQVVRRPRDGVVTCHGGGFIASGASGTDRLPIPVLPEGLSLLPLEGAGEVQTPLAFSRAVRLSLGDPVFFRHAKAGELAEHFDEYLLIRGDRLAGRARTYRGLGKCWLG